MSDVRDELAIRRLGRGRPLVLAHGRGCDQTVWAPLVEEWARAHEVITFDYTGCGQATRRRDPERYGALEGYALDLLDVLGEVGQPATVIGHSISGSIGLLAAIERPAMFERLVMLAPSPRFLDDPTTGYVGGFSEEDVAAVIALIDRNFIDMMPGSQLRVIDVPGHCPHITAPDVIASELRTFLGAA